MHIPTRLLVTGAALLGPGALAGQDTTARRLPAVVTITREAERPTLDLPFAISVATPDTMRPGQAHVAVEQTLFAIPGLTVSNRHNPSQDARISIRGFGARSPFGVRSVRILRDGLPLTLPDGQTPIDYLDLESVGQVEVIRGTASSLYGNASGGVVDLRSTAPAASVFAPEIRAWGGSNDFSRVAAVASGTGGRASWLANVGRTRSDGYRLWSNQRTANGYARAAFDGDRIRASVSLMGADTPLAQNPGALTRTQYDSSARAADPLAVRRKARKEVSQLQAGATIATDAGPVALNGYGYLGTRSLFNPLTFAIVGIDRSTSGAGVRGTTAATTRRNIGLSLTGGFDYQRLRDDRTNHANCNGVTTPTANCPAGTDERGALQLDQEEQVDGYGAYGRAEANWSRARVTVGARYDAITFRLADRFLADNRNDSGDRRLTAVSPMIGIVVPMSATASAYANVSTAFETPTTTELGNQADGRAGINPDLDPQRSATFEAGVRGIRSRIGYDLSVFRTEVRDELVQFEVVGGGGRTYFRNAGRTRRTGAELAARTTIARVDLDGAYSWSHFRFRDFLSAGKQVGGNAIPGIPEHQAQVSATWRSSRGFAVAEWLGRSSVAVNDANTARAEGYGLLNLRVGARSGREHRHLQPVVAVQNVFDRRYIASVAVNAAGSPTTAKFYEPGAGRTLLIGVQAGW